MLAKIGRNDVAYRLLHNDTFPSWGFSIKHGATSHLGALGRLDAREGLPGPRHELLRPLLVWRRLPVDGRKHRRHPRPPAPPTRRSASPPSPAASSPTPAPATTRSAARSKPTGNLRTTSSTLEVTIPANTTATVVLPGGEPSRMAESGRSLSDSPGISEVNHARGQTTLQIGSGKYRFTVPAS